MIKSRNVISLLLLAASVLQFACSPKRVALPVAEPESHTLPDTLVVGTLYGPTSFFIFRGDTMGYDYDRARDFAAQKGIAIEFRVARSMQSLISMLDADSVSVLACEVPIIAEYQKRMIHCGEKNVTYQVLVQPKSDSLVTDVTQLVGKTVWVEAGSKYEARLHNLDNEVGGGINIRTIATDTLITEDLIELVSKGEIPMTVIDSDIAQLNQQYYEDIDISLKVSFEQRASWAVSLQHQWLADSINAWSSQDSVQAMSRDLLKHYFEISEVERELAAGLIDSVPPIPKGHLTPFDELFQKHGEQTDFDWLLLAAIAKVESRYNSHVVSWAGAKGMMQLMPSTAAHYGVKEDQLTDPDLCLLAASLHLVDLRDYFAARVEDEQERLRMMLAAYNSGLGHIIDAMALAEKYELDPLVWYENVETALLWKSKPEYYNDRACQYGYFVGHETVDYVKKVEEAYEALKEAAQKINYKKKKHK